jgi:PAS domain S-box-containing protein
LDERFKQINKLLSAYSLGRFEKRLPISPKLDEVDAFIAGVNMLGEELKVITISRNYFTNIFNSVSDMVFILDKKGSIENLNQSVVSQLGYAAEHLIGKSMDILVDGEKPSFLEGLLRQLKNRKGAVSTESLFCTATQTNIPVQVTAAHLIDDRKRKAGIIITAKDITLQLKAEKLIIRAIIDTQEKERLRLAQDLHDSLGQSLSAIKFYISATVEGLTDEKEKAGLIKSSDALTEVIAEMRDICFNLMPKTLKEFGLWQAVKEICSKFQQGRGIEFDIKQIDPIPELSKELEIDLYRVIQEFITNSIKHGYATNISISFSHSKNIFGIILKDKGKGFDPKTTSFTGMGFQNMQSRVKSHNGTLVVQSEPGKGIAYFVTIPVNNTP